MMRKERDIEMKVGIFVTAGVVLVGLAILFLGGGSLSSRQLTYTTHFGNVDGLISGAKVALSGLQVGRVEELAFDHERRDVKVTLEIDSKYAEWIRADSHAEIATQGMLGDKFIVVAGGSPSAERLPPGSELPSESGEGIASVISKSDELMGNLNSISRNLDRMFKQFDQTRSERVFQGLADTSRNLSVATAKLNEEIQAMNLKATSQSLNQILAKINSGTGTLGALINDPTLYYDVKGLVGGANRNKIVRNLVRKTIKDAEEAEAKQGAGKDERAKK